MGSYVDRNPFLKGKVYSIGFTSYKGYNWWAEKMGGFIEKRIDAAYTILTSSHDDRKIIVHWTPGKSFLSNRAIPCIHADPCWGDLAPGKSITVYGELIFTRAQLEEIINEFPIK